MKLIFLAIFIGNIIVQGFSLNCVDRSGESTCGAYCFQALLPILNQTTRRTIDEDKLKMDASVSLMVQQKFDEYEKKMERKLNDLVERVEKREKLVAEPFEKIGSKYYYIDDKIELNWYDAVSKCTRLGGHLVSLVNEDEFNLIVKKLKKTFYWTDINDLGKEGEYISLSTGRNPKFLKWMKGEPNNIQHDEYCVELKLWNGVYAMNDDRCRKLNYYICEKTL